ncbi:MAG: serine/threonine-protein kinase [Gemmatimonadota bacterium]|nr:serine/threonine-protein kinase [Gemmatimonadota bacterium]
MSQVPPESPDLPASGSSQDPLELPDRVGAYKILQLIGEGGMGVVYEAEQTEPVTRRVAFKVLKPGVDTKQVVARFEAERQALAVMDHPSIAKVLDAGVTEAGRPFFVMELVKGIPLNDYCDSFKLSTRQRLELFIEICRAVQHAHQKGLIHRDLKPSNVLVMEQDDRPVPKIIDFGVAKAVSQPLTERTLVTEYGRAIGTPAYMSPEQAGYSGLDVDTRADLYSLGVLLYELLVGSLPVEPREVGMPEFFAQLVMRETEPPSPSMRFSSLGNYQQAVAEFRQTDPRSLERELKGDLDWIVMKAMEKNRSRRYATTNGLASDIERYLRDEPVAARPPSAAYRFLKFVRRNKAAVATAAVVAVALVTGVIATTVALVRVSRAEAATAREAESAKQVSDFLVGLFKVSDPGEARGNTITAREVLDRGANEIAAQLQDQPLVQARWMATMGEVYNNMGLFDQARPLLERALAIREDMLEPDHLDVAESLERLAALLRERGGFVEAEPLLQRAVAIREQQLSPDHPDLANALANLGATYLEQGRYEDAEPVLRRALAIRERTLGPNDPAVASNVGNLGILFWSQRKFAEAEPFFERSVAINERVLGSDHPSLGSSLNNLGGLYFMQEKYEEATRAYERAREIWVKTLEPNHPDIAKALNNLAEVYWVQGKYADAEDYFRRSLAIKEEIFQSDHPLIASSLNGLANVYRDQRRYDESEPLYQRALAIRRSALQPADPAIVETLTDYADMLRKANRPTEAAELEAQAEVVKGQGAGSGQR